MFQIFYPTFAPFSVVLLLEKLSNSVLFVQLLLEMKHIVHFLGLRKIGTKFLIHILKDFSKFLSYICTFFGISIQKLSCAIVFSLYIAIPNEY